MCIRDRDGDILCDPVDKITGPGNIFVATAKSLVSAFVGIDAVAGPTEIGIIADETANPSLLAADLIGQAEHDELAGSVLFTDSTEIADKAVSYTHLDVYKRQGRGTGKSVPHGSEVR